MPAGQATVDAEEREVAAFLSGPATYGVAQVEVVETHIARVFLAGDRAYKVRKRVRLPFLDFTTLAARYRAACREFEINRPHAPDLYLDIVPIARAAGGSFELGGRGEAVDWAVCMRRFDQEALLARQARKGPFSEDLARALATMAADYHRACPIAAWGDGAGLFAPVVGQLKGALGSDREGGGSAFVGALACAFERTSPLLTQRGREGCIRRCHGDLHLGNIVLIDSVPVPFDALEFSEELATIDVLYDLAFLLMDLDVRGDRQAANVVLNAYAGAAPIGHEISGLACLPLFLACRAGVRAVVALERRRQLSGADEQTQQMSAQRHVDLALSYLAPPPPILVAIGGLSGTGKSTLAALLAHRVGPSPGALLVRSDVERKRLFGVPETQRLERQHYRIGVAQRVYSILEAHARDALRAGHAIIVDAVFAKPEERSAIEAVAQEAGCDFVGLWLTAPAELLMERVAKRQGDASDADRRVVKEQLGYDLGEMSWTEVDAGGTPQQSLDEAVEALRAAGVRLAERGPPPP